MIKILNALGFDMVTGRNHDLDLTYPPCRKIIHANNHGGAVGEEYKQASQLSSTNKVVRTRTSMGSGGDGGNLKNAIVAFLAPLPSILFYLSFLNRVASTGSEGDSLSLPPLWTWCYHHPLLLANALFFLNVNVLFWLIGHIQDSHWVRAHCLLAAFCRFSFRLIVDFRCFVWLGCR